MRNLALLLFTVLVGCAEQAPTYVYVPGEAVEESVFISASQVRGKVDSPIILHATRRTKGYIKVRYDTLPKGACWWRRAPPAYEEEVADNVRWHVEPQGMYKANSAYREDHTKEFIFKQPGKYRIYAESAAWCPPKTVSNTIEIVIAGNE